MHLRSGETYGAPRVHAELQAEGLPASPKRVARLMREEGLAARPRNAYRVSTTDSQHDDPIAPNLLARQCDVHGIGINRVWVADITYVPTREGMLTWRPSSISAPAGAWAGRCGTPWKKR